MENIEETHNYTQYGLKFPNADIQWADNDGNIQLVDEVAQVFNLIEPPSTLTAVLSQRAVIAHMDPSLYVSMHRIVTREIVTTVSAPVEASSLEIAAA